MEKITVQELENKIENHEDFLLLDVRDPFEQYQANIEYKNHTIIPADQLAGRLDEVEAGKSEEIVCMCRAGSRSSESAELLEEHGYKNVKLLAGGVNRWAEEIDNSLPIY